MLFAVYGGGTSNRYCGPDFGYVCLKCSADDEMNDGLRQGVSVAEQGALFIG